MSLTRSFMAKMAKLDTSLQRGLDNGFAFIFGGQVVPAELEEMLKQEAADNIVRTYDNDEVEAPHWFRIELSPKDFKKLSHEHPQLPDNLADLMTRYIRNQGWIINHKVVVQLELDPSLKTGQLRPQTSSEPVEELSGFFPKEEVHAPEKNIPIEESEEEMNFPQTNSHASTEFMQAQPQPHAPVQQSSGPTITLLLQDGSSRTYLVQNGRNLIGRGNDVDFRLPDTGVSRHHLEITWDGHDAVLTDLHSTNGTLVNDMPVENWLLADGDVITIGHSYIEVRITGL